MHDVLIIGAGPAGISAALWARSAGLEVLLLDAAEHVGGQLHRIYFHPESVIGFDEGDGAALAARYAQQLQGARIPLECGVRAAGIDVGGGPGAGLTVRLADGGSREARTVLIATGLRRRRLEVPGEGKFEGQGVYASATRNIDTLKGRDVVVVGGGDSGFENALILHDANSTVTLVVRGEPHARADFRTRVANAGIDVLDHTSVLEILGDDAVERIRVERRGQSFTHDTSAVVVKIGNLPNTEWCGGAVDLDDEGYVVVGETLETLTPGVWAAGDVTRPGVPAIPVATGQGALAAAEIRKRLNRP